MRPSPDEAFDLAVLEEKAVALVRVAAQMEEALAALRSVDEGDERWPELLAEARDCVWCYVVQREAMGLRDRRDALEVHAVPSDVRSRMGPRRRG